MFAATLICGSGCIAGGGTKTNRRLT